MKSTINLIAEVLEGEQFPVEKVLLPTALFLPMLFVLLASLWQVVTAKTLGLQLQQIMQKRDVLTQEVTHLTEEITNFQHQETAERQSEDKKLTAVKGLLKDRILWSEVFRDMSLIAPQGVWLTSVDAVEPASAVSGGGSSGLPAGQAGAQPPQTTEGKQVKFTGFANSNAAVTQFISALERSERFTEVALVYSQKNGAPDSQKTSFEIACNLRSVQL